MPISVSDAGYQNYIGFYAVADVQGTLANGLKVGDVGVAYPTEYAAFTKSRGSCSNARYRTCLEIIGDRIDELLVHSYYAIDSG